MIQNSNYHFILINSITIKIITSACCIYGCSWRSVFCFSTSEVELSCEYYRSSNVSCSTALLNHPSCIGNSRLDVGNFSLITNPLRITTASKHSLSRYFIRHRRNFSLEQQNTFSIYSFLS